MNRADDLICIVDDDESVLRALGRMVATMGNETRLMSSSRECLDSAYIDRAACLIVDVNMPGIDGFELHALLQASGRGVPTIFMSGLGHDEYLKKSRAIGAAAFLGKPSDEIELRDAIDRALAANGTQVPE